MSPIIAATSICPLNGISLYIFFPGSNQARVAPLIAPIAVKCALVTPYF
jgi:hypothetical protein